MKIKSKLIILFLLISIIPLITLSAYSINSAKTALSDAIGKGVEALAKEKAHAMTLVIRDLINEAKILSEIKVVQDAVISANLSYEGKTDSEVLASIMKIDKEWIASKGRTKVAKRILDSHLSGFLNKYQNRDDRRYGEIFLTDRRGATVAATKILSDYYQADEEWWEGGYNDGKGNTFLDDRGYDKSIKAIAMGVVVPVRKDGEVIGILKINFKIHTITDIVFSLGDLDGYTGKLANTEREILTHTVGKGHENITEEEIFVLKQNESGWVSDIHDEEKTIMGYAPVDIVIHSRTPTPGEIKGISGEKWKLAKWFMLIHVAEEKAFAPVDDLTLNFIFAVVLIAIAVMVVALFFSRTISRPVHKLITGMGKVGAGDLSVRVGTASDDEIGELSRAFDKMTIMIKTSTTSIAKLNKEVEVRKMIEEALAAKSNDLAKAQQLAKIGNWALHPESGKIEGSDELFRIFGLSRNDVTLEAFVSAVHPDDKDYDVGTIQNSIETGQPYNIEHRLLMKDGAVKWVQAIGEPILDRTGKRNLLIGTVQDITERKKIEEALRESEELFRTTFEGAGIGIALADMDGRPLKVNKRLLQMLDYSEDEHLWKSFHEITHPDDLAPNLELFEKLKAGKLSHFEMDKRYIKRDGSTMWGHLVVSEVLGGDGSPKYSIAMIEDITERKRAEEALDKSELWFRSTFESLEEGVFVVTPDRRVANVNKAALTMFGYSIEEFKEHSTEILHVDHDHYVQFGKRINEAFDKHEAANFEFELKRKNGEIFPSEHTVSLLQDKSGKALGIVSVVRDITKRKQAEEKLRLTQFSIDSSYDSISWIDSDGRFKWVNDAICKKLGYSYEELTSMGVADIDPDFPAQAWPKHWEEIKKRGSFNFESHHKTKDGVIFPVEVTINYIEFEGKEYNCAFARDITDRKKAEDEITRNASLLSLIAKSQSSFIVDSSPHLIFDSLLTGLLELTKSEYGFIGEVCFDDKGEKFLKVFAWTNIAWNKETRALYEKYKKGGAEFHNLKTLYGAVLTTGELVLANDPANDPRSGGIPKGHPPLNAFIGLPIKRDGESIGMVGLANKVGGYDDKLAEYLEPLIKTCSGIISAINNEIFRKESEAKLKLSAMVFENAMEGVIVTDSAGVIQFVNQAFAEITGFGEKEAIGQTPRLVKSNRQDKKFYEKMWGDLLKTGRWQGEVWNRRKNSELFIVQQSINAIKDSDGKTTEYVSVFHDITEAKQDEEEIKYQAYHDLLTGLPNRSLFNDRLKQTIGRAEREKQKVALLFIDVDDFKNINDNFGHLVGDLLLQGIAMRLTTCVRETDTVARYSGDEFVVIMDNIKEAQAVASVAENILESLSEPYMHHGKNIISTVSIGIAMYPTDGESGEALLKNADLAMYHIKDNRKNSFSFFTESLNEQATRRYELEVRLREAIERDEFTVYYQPKISLSSGKINSMEALVRWKTDGNLILPSEFIPLAEDTGLIFPIGEFVLVSACEQLKIWHDMGYKYLSVSVNISTRQFDKGDLLDVVKSAITSTGLNAASLRLEITETAIMKELESALLTLDQIKKMGVNISLDDFGTGYSSLSHLRVLPIDELKIDRIFIMNIPDNLDDSAIVATIISMAQSLKLSVVAEGVETRDQLDFLREAGCDEMQGYLFSRPVPAGEMEKLLKDGKTLSFT